MTELEQVEQDISTYKEQVALGTALDRLSSNKDFKLLIAKGYFIDKAAELVSLTATKGIDQEFVIRQMAGIANLQDYFRLIRKSAVQAAKSLIDSESTREAIAQEELENE